MGKIILGILLKLRQWMQAIFASVFNKIKDPKTGKLSFTSPGNAIKLAWIIGLCFFIMIVASKFFSDKKFAGNGADDFRKELVPSTGINDNPSEAVMDGDPLGNILKQNAEKFGKNAGKDGSSLDGNLSVMGLPTSEECQSLMGRMKNGEDLTGSNKDKMNTCLEKNIGNWTPDQLQFAKALLNDNTLTAAEKELLRKGIAGTLTPEELALARALSGTDPIAKALARQAIKSGDEDLKNALAHALMGKALTENEKTLLGGLASDASKDLGKALGKSEKDLLDYLTGLAKGAISGGNGANGKGANGGADGTSGSNGLSPEALKALAAEMANKEAELKAMRDQLAAAQAAAAAALEKGSKGRELTADEQAKINAWNELQKKLAELEKEQNERRINVLKNASLLQETLAEVSKTVEEDIPSNFSIAYQDAPLLDCRQIKPLGKHIARVKKIKSNTLLGLDGKPLTPDKVQLISLRRKSLAELARERGDVNNPTGAGSGFSKGAENISLAAQGQGENGQQQKTEVQNLFFYQDKNLKPFTLTPDMKVPAVLLSQILVTDKGHSAVVRVKVLDNVYNPENNTIVIPKGSVIVGSTQSFDADTGIMDLNLNKVSIGSGKVIAQNFTVGSADGSTGLKGQVYDTRGKYLLGAFVSAFTSGALNWFSQQIVQPFQTSTDAGTALTGAGLGGGAEALNKLSELMVSDLQNAAKIFFVPKGVPMILYPAD